MKLLDEVNKHITSAMRARDQHRLDALRMLKAALVNRDIEKGRDLDEAEERQVVATLVKQRRDSIEQFTRGGRADLVDKESREIEILQRYLPPAVDPAAIEATVDAVIAELGASGARDIGPVMKGVMSRLAGQTVDGKAINELVRRKLTGR
ncbi:MAG: GatB/YqeY domain-containing protein [Acidobacteria bacterium]|nr:GatB/YqeY domain-containing protein [Acidobacteriota bacterium]